MQLSNAAVALLEASGCLDEVSCSHWEYSPWNSAQALEIAELQLCITLCILEGHHKPLVQHTTLVTTS